jgi:hypothetical protein
VGGVTSGIVGRSLPRLGLFGSNVERTKRLHQTSLPGKIQCSKDFCDLVRHRSVKLMPGQVMESASSKGNETGYIVTGFESKSGIALMAEKVEGALRELAQFREVRDGNEGTPLVSSSDYDTSGAVIRRLESGENGGSVESREDWVDRGGRGGSRGLSGSTPGSVLNSSSGSAGQDAGGACMAHDTTLVQPRPPVTAF